MARIKTGKRRAFEDYMDNGARVREWQRVIGYKTYHFIVMTIPGGFVAGVVNLYTDEQKIITLTDS